MSARTLKELATSIYQSRIPFVLLIGNGASISSGIKSNNEIVIEILKEYDEYSPELSEQEKISRFNRIWNQNRYLRETFREKYLTVEGPSSGYLALAHLVQRGYFNPIFTLNFDSLLENSLRIIGVKDQDYTVVYRSLENDRNLGDILRRSDPKIKIVKLHKPHDADSFLYTTEEMVNYPDSLKSVLNEYFSRNIVVCGYSFSDLCVTTAFAHNPQHQDDFYYVNPRGKAGADNSIKNVIGFRRRDIVIEGEQGLADNFFIELWDKLFSLSVQKQFPYPIAKSFSMVEVGESIEDKFESLHRVFENAIKFVAAVTLVHYRDLTAGAPEENEDPILQSAIARIFECFDLSSASDFCRLFYASCGSHRSDVFFRPFLEFLEDFPKKALLLSRKIINWTKAETSPKLYQTRRQEVFDCLLQLDFLRRYTLIAEDAVAKAKLQVFRLTGQNIESTDHSQQASAECRVRVIELTNLSGIISLGDIISVDPYLLLLNSSNGVPYSTLKMCFYRSGYESGMTKVLQYSDLEDNLSDVEVSKDRWEPVLPTTRKFRVRVFRSRSASRESYDKIESDQTEEQIQPPQLAQPGHKESEAPLRNELDQLRNVDLPTPSHTSAEIPPDASSYGNKRPTIESEKRRLSSEATADAYDQIRNLLDLPGPEQSKELLKLWGYDLAISPITVHANETLKRHILAKYPLLYVLSYEEVRVIKAFADIAHDNNLKLYSWSFHKGVVDSNNNPLPELIENPGQVIDWCIERQEEAVFILKDFHDYLENPLIIRRVRDAVREFKEKRKSMIFLSPINILPTELERDVTVMSYPLPQYEELDNLLSEIIRDRGVKEDYLSNTQQQLEDFEKLGIQIAARSQLVSGCRGLTLLEARNLFSKAIAKRGGIFFESIAEIVEEKEQLIKKSGFLEFYTSMEQFASIGGLENLKAWLDARGQPGTLAQELLGMSPPKGILLVGVPGCGKSLCAKAIAAHWSVPLLRLDLGRIFGGRVGESEANMRNSISIAEAASPCVLWIDEIEKGFSDIWGGSTGVTSRIFGTFLTWMQDKTAPVFVVATANDISSLPPEFLRKGRFDEIFFVDLPTPEEREQIFRIHLNKRKLKSEKFPIADFVALSHEHSGAEIEQSIVSALYEAFDQGKTVDAQLIKKSIKTMIPLTQTASGEIRSIRKRAEAISARPASL